MAPETSSVGGSLAWATGEVRAHGQSRRRQRGSSRLKIRRVVGRLATTRTSPPRSRILRAALSTAAYPFASMNSTPSRSTRRDPSAFAAAALRASAKRPAVRASISPRAATTIDLADPLRRLTSATGSQGVMSRPRTASLDQSPLQTRARLERGRDRRMVRKAFLIDRLKGVDEVLGALARLSFGDQVLLAHGIVQPLELRQDFEVIHHHSRSPCLVWSSASDVVPKTSPRQAPGHDDGGRRGPRRVRSLPMSAEAREGWVPLQPGTGSFAPGPVPWPGARHFAPPSFVPLLLLPGPKSGSPNAGAAEVSPRAQMAAAFFFMSLLP